MMTCRISKDERVRDLVNRLREESSGQKAMRYKPTEGGHARPPSRYKEWSAPQGPSAATCLQSVLVPSP
eukprot:4669369-Amphidinium_carterae.1